MKKDSVIMKNRVRKFLDEHEVRISEEVYETLDLKVKEFLLNALKRTKDNRRSTLMRHDL